MPGVYAAALAQEVIDGGRPAVVDDGPGLIDELVAKLGDECLDRHLVDCGVERDARYHVAERHDFAELRHIARDPVVQPPLEVHGMAEECRLAVDRRRTPADHSHLRVGEM